MWYVMKLWSCIFADISESNGDQWSVYCVVRHFPGKWRASQAHVRGANGCRPLRDRTTEVRRLSAIHAYRAGWFRNHAFQCPMSYGRKASIREIHGSSSSSSLGNNVGMVGALTQKRAVSRQLAVGRHQRAASIRRRLRYTDGMVPKATSAGPVL
jgi:hypothetical protein